MLFILEFATIDNDDKTWLVKTDKIEMDPVLFPPVGSQTISPRNKSGGMRRNENARIQMELSRNLWKQIREETGGTMSGITSKQTALNQTCYGE